MEITGVVLVEGDDEVLAVEVGPLELPGPVDGLVAAALEGGDGPAVGAAPDVPGPRTGALDLHIGAEPGFGQAPTEHRFRHRRPTDVAQADERDAVRRVHGRSAVASTPMPPRGRWLRVTVTRFGCAAV